MAVFGNKEGKDGRHVMNMKVEVFLGDTPVGLVELWLDCSVGMQLMRGVSPACRRILM